RFKLKASPAQPYRPRLGERVVHSWDIAYTMGDRADWTVCATWLCRDNGYFLIDILRTKVEIPELMKLVPAYADRWQAERVFMEATGAGIGILTELKRRDPSRYLPHNPKEPKD